MKKMITICMFAVTLYLQGQETPATIAFTDSGPSNWLKIQKDGYIGYIDNEGMEIIPPVYEEIGKPGEYQENWLMVIKDGYIGFVDLEGKVVVQPQYETIGKRGEYKENWYLVRKDGFYGFINTVGEEVVKPVYEEIELTKNNSLQPETNVLTETVQFKND